MNDDDEVVFVPTVEPEVIQIDSDEEMQSPSFSSQIPHPPVSSLTEKFSSGDLFFEDKGDKNTLLNVPQYSLISDTSLTFSQNDEKVQQQELEDGEIISQPTPVSPSPCDESVIFVSEKPGPSGKRKQPSGDFISFYEGAVWLKEDNKVAQQQDTPSSPSPKPPPAKKVARKNAKKVAVNSQKGSDSSKKKRMVVLDGSNVALFGEKTFSVEKLKIAIEYFERRGHEVKAVVPQYRVKPSKSTNRDLLEKLASEGKVVLTPCKNIPGICVQASYDDRRVQFLFKGNNKIYPKVSTWFKRC